MAKSFSAAVDAWAAQTKERIAAVHARSIEKLGVKMTQTVGDGGRVPFQFGNLARSLLASTESMPTTSEGPFDGSNVGLVAAKLKPDQTVWLGYQANYARRQNYGFVGADSLGRVYNQTGHYFVEYAIAEWDNIVKEAISELKGS